jgi:hypothetical protein
MRKKTKKTVTSNSATRKRKTPRKRIAGYWVFPKAEGSKAYYVKPYLRKKQSYVRKAPKGYKLVKHYDIYAEEERIVYTYKAEVLAWAKTTSGGYSFAKGETVSKDTRVLQYWHSHFEPTIEKATVDFKAKAKEIEAYGEVQWLAIDLYRVSGIGKLTEKHWKLLQSFDDPDEIH